jgi:hypothetical protein
MYRLAARQGVIGDRPYPEQRSGVVLPIRTSAGAGQQQTAFSK